MNQASQRRAPKYLWKIERLCSTCVVTVDAVVVVVVVVVVDYTLQEQCEATY